MENCKSGKPVSDTGAAREGAGLAYPALDRLIQGETGETFRELRSHIRQL